MQTRFSPAQLADPVTADSERAIRKCVHCGFCLATCPTYQLLGDENDSPRGRIYLMKEMLEHDRPATADVVTHIDRCLSCLSCMTTCPSGVDYRRLVDQARAHIEKTYERPLADRLHRAFLAWLMPRPWAFRRMISLAPLGRPFRWLMPERLKTMLDLAPNPLPRRSVRPVREPGARRTDPAFARMRVALLPGCVQQTLAPDINAAAERLLTRQGAAVVLAHKPDCCGSLTHHLGKEDQAHATARRAIDRWIAEMDGDGLDRIAITASGCGATIKDYPAMFRGDPAYAEKAERVAGIAKDITEVVAELGLPRTVRLPVRRVAYQAACSLQHGQKIDAGPRALLRDAGFELTPVAEGHLCCGSAGTYNILQPKLATALKERKIVNLVKGKPEAIATGNIGCLMQIASGTEIPVAHIVELLDWATGGPLPAALERAGIEDAA
jgi:glycolate oxidase iron-sulfur subunit